MGFLVEEGGRAALADHLKIHTYTKTIAMISKALIPLFYFGLVLLTIGTLFKIQHWPYGRAIQSAGILFEAGFFVGVAFEIITSKKASRLFKAVFVPAYVLLPILGCLYVAVMLLIFAILIGGTFYLQKLRKKVLFTRTEVISKQFDSI